MHNLIHNKHQNSVVISIYSLEYTSKTFQI